MKLLERDANKVLRPTTAVPKVKRKRIRPKSAKRSTGLSPKPLKKQPLRPEQSFTANRPWEARHNRKKGRAYSAKKKNKWATKSFAAEPNSRVSGAVNQLNDIMEEAKEKFNHVGWVERRMAKADEQKQLDRV